PALGRGGSRPMVAVFLFLRLLGPRLVGPGFGHGFARFPLYLGEALAVEGAFLYFARWSSLALAAVSGLLAAVVGLATEWLWVNLWYQHPWGAPLLPYLWLALLMGPVAATVGMAMGRVVGGGRAGPARRPGRDLAGSLPGLRSGPGGRQLEGPRLQRSRRRGPGGAGIDAARPAVRPARSGRARRRPGRDLPAGEPVADARVAR